MAQQPQQTRTNDPLQELQQEYGMGGVQQGHAIMPIGQGQTAINIFGGMITAQRVAVPRDIVAVKRRLETLAATFGCDNWIYRWKVKNRSKGTEDTIEGGTIKLANDLAREWGNCQVDIRVIDEGNHWMFYGRFVDLETGYSLTRPYQQRKSQNTGMQDQQRALDMVMQIGASKCIRNVVLNALQALADSCMTLADNDVKERVKKSPEKAKEWIIKELDKVGVDLKRVERVVGRTSQNWTVVDMAGLFTELRSVTDGMVLADDIWPSDATLAARKKAGDFTPKETPKPDDAPKTAPTAADDTPGPNAGADDDKPPTTQKTKTPYVVKNDVGVAMGTLDVAPELGSEITFLDVAVRVIEVTEDPKVVVIKVSAPTPKTGGNAASKAAAVAEKAKGKAAAATSAPAATGIDTPQGGNAADPGDNLFND